MKLAELQTLADPFAMMVTQEQEEGIDKRIWVFRRLGRTTFLRDTERYRIKQYKKGVADCAAKLDEMAKPKTRKKRKVKA